MHKNGQNYRIPDLSDLIEEIKINGGKYHFFSLKKLESRIGFNISSLPYSIRILILNILSNFYKIDEDPLIYISRLLKYRENKGEEIPFFPLRVIMQDFTGVPAIVDLAAMRDGMVEMGGKGEMVKPLIKCDLIIDHSVQIDEFGSIRALETNIEKEFKRNRERYEFLKWGSRAFKNLNIIPPSSGIIHQINLEYLARIACIENPPVMFSEMDKMLYYDTLVGTDSHTTMIGGLGVLGWGVGGIEAEAGLLNFPISTTIPEVVGFKLKGKLTNGANATDLALTITKILRDIGVVGKFVEFFGDGVKSLSLPDRATISNMSPEYGATISFFPVDQNTINYLEITGRNREIIDTATAFTKAQGLFRTDYSEDIEYSEVVELDLESVEPSIAGPKKPHEYIALKNIKQEFSKNLSSYTGLSGNNNPEKLDKKVEIEIEKQKVILEHGSIVIAAITSCTNTSNPYVLIAAGLLAKKAVELGLKRHPLTKTSFTPGSKAVKEYLEDAGLMPYLEALGFHIVGYGCATCIGNSGPLNPVISKAIQKNGIYAVSVLSGNRNFEGRIHPDVRGNYLVSPPMVVAYSIAGNIGINIMEEPLGYDPNGKPVYLKEIIPEREEVLELINRSVDKKYFQKVYGDILKGSSEWESIPVNSESLFNWKEESTYIRKPPFFKSMTDESKEDEIKNARVLALLGDTVTTDHISPAGTIPVDSPAGKWLLEHGVKPEDFNTYGSRRGNHEVMIRGTFANIRLRNLLVPDKEGGYTVYFPSNKIMTIFEAAQKYAEDNTPLILLAGKEYGTGSSRDWAAKGTMLLGVKAVIAKSFERIHRSNLVGMGVLPLQFKDGEGVKELGMDGSETFEIGRVTKPGQTIRIVAKDKNKTVEFEAVVRIDSEKELEYYRSGGILNYALKKLLLDTDNK